ncbi:SusC/RagA family TonB-linked outer membrane protein [Sinomicrobium weinanense]|uniref:TonB-dependent receptor n=1 Tax=Sinomicrobium weinanense TaxID=2842200 RepID=A0A926JTE1_9FLAO|nr:TonB-dependent receptor [Sinomicrobium weinanense]MBC9797150.1 TonB-dependent receptor [Sinomicrobium weinanense]MBU3124491.1 TonB-dependent receptor [Sinomicrobium weinanense]
MKNVLILFLNLFFIGVCWAQGQVSGIVTDAESGEPLLGVNIIVKGASAGAVTDFNGEYQLNVPEGSTLIFSYIGYIQQEVAVNNKETINIALAPDVSVLKEVVIIGYGTQKKENLTGSVSAVKGGEIATQPVMQPSQALMGKMPGVTALQSSSQPGADGATLRIRGIGTLSNSDPLVLIDGVPGNMDGIDPRDIENISVLKDAASAAIYGSRAANGVVLITTKRGRMGKLSVNYNGYVGWQDPTEMPEFADGGEYMKLYNIARQNLGQEPAFPQEYIDAWQEGHLTDPDQYPDTDWANEIFSRNGFQQHHSLSLSGGGELARVMGSFSFMEQQGNIPGFSYKRYNARINTDLSPSEKFNFNFDISFRRSVRDEPITGLGVVRESYRNPPVYASRFSDGTWGPGWNGSNPIARVRDGGGSEDQYHYLRAILKANYKPAEGLQFSLMYSPQYNETMSKSFTRQYEYYEYGDTSPSLYPTRNELSQGHDRDLTHMVLATGSYEKDLNDHFFKVLTGYELNTYRRDWITASRDNFSLQDYPYLQNGSKENMQNDGSASEWGLHSFFTRVNYDYKGKYLLEANVRVDGSSRFAKGNKYGTFPAFSAGWRVAEESFMENINWLDELKLRASWGRLGNQNVGTYPFASTVSLGMDYLFGGEPVNGAAQRDMANKDISWETTETTNFGIDLALFKNRLSLSAEYYIRNTYDILLQLPIPATIGLSAPYQNAGKINNKGWDLAVGWKDKIGEFHYGIDFNISDVHNKVEDLHGTGPYIGETTIVQEGYPINSLYGYRSDGFFQSGEEVDRAPEQFGAIAPGDIRYTNQLTVDTNGDGIPDAADELINADDRVVLGDPFPRYTYGMNFTADYKGFDFSALLQGVGKRDVYLQQDAGWAFYNAGKIQRWQMDYWSPENPDASYPRLVATSSHNNFKMSDFWIWNSSYLRLRNLTLGYTLPQKVSEKFSMDRFRFYVSGQNLFTIHDMPKGWDPETPNSTGGNIYPIMAIYTLGVDITF